MSEIRRPQAMQTHPQTERSLTAVLGPFERGLDVLIEASSFQPQTCLGVIANSPMGYIEDDLMENDLKSFF